MKALFIINQDSGSITFVSGGLDEAQAQDAASTISLELPGDFLIALDATVLAEYGSDREHPYGTTPEEIADESDDDEADDEADDTQV